MLSALLLGFSLLAADAPSIYSLNAGTSVWDVTCFDVNNDSRGDVVAVCCDENSQPLKKFIAIYFADENGAYSTNPSATVPIDSSLSVLFPVEIDGKAPKELAAASAEGLVALGFSEGSLAPVFETKFMSLFPSGAREPNFIKDTAQDIDGDGIDEWFVPMPTGFALRNPKGEVAQVRCDVTSSVRTGSGMYVSNKFPAYHAFSMDGQNEKAIAFLSDEFADFAYGADWKQKERFKIPVKLGDKWDTNSDMEDFNGDGLPDLIVTQTQGTINLKALTQVYFAQGPMKYGETPTAKFESTGSFAAPVVKDVNGDKKLDIIFVNIPLGVRSIVNFFMWHKLGVDLEIYINNGNGFGTKPDYSTSVTIEAPDGKEQSAYCMGDFNGDGKTDAAFGAGKQKLMLHGGGDAKFISSKPYLTLDVPAFGIARPYKLNDNSAEDIVIYHPGIAQKEKIEVLVF
ncbi:MAG: VCBS repeat-containing protein [Candidatus Hydrogenedentes bacterium]|nr:VCBS repeat-containing protein [Candidatus Hydrogenedentota bacterium]